MFSVDVLNLSKNMDDMQSILLYLNTLNQEIEDSEIRALAMVNTSRNLRHLFATMQVNSLELGKAISPLIHALEDLRRIFEVINITNEYVTGLVDCVDVEELKI